MDNILATHYTDKRVDAVLSPYDGISRGIIAALKQVGYYTADKPAPVVSGQDAELPSVKSILAGEQTSTVFKDTRLLAAQAAKMVNQMLTGETVEVNDTDHLRERRQDRPVLPPGHGQRDQGQRPARSWSTPATTRPTRSSPNQVAHNAGVRRSPTPHTRFLFHPPDSTRRRFA